MVCTPGLNCYSCPAAIMSCPIGALQLFIAGARYSISLFVTGFLITTGIIFGRLICGYVCPVGLIQDLMYKIKVPKRKVQFHFLRYIKYFVLIVFVVLLPLFLVHNLSGLGEPWFCKYICPSGTIFGAIPLLAVNGFLRELGGVLLAVNLFTAAVLLICAIIIFRPFCRMFCPLGAIYALFNKIAFLKMRCDKEKCISCNKCAQACHIMLQPSEQPNSPECVRCGSCKAVCDLKALK